MIKALVKGLVPKIRSLARAGKLPAGQTEEHYYDKIGEILDNPKSESAPKEGEDKSKAKTQTAPTFADPIGRTQLEGEAVFGAAESDVEEQMTASLAKGELAGEKVKVRKVKRALIWGKPRGLATIYFYNRKGQKGNFLRAHIHLRVHLEPKAKKGAEGKTDKAVVEDIKAIVQEIENTASGGSAGRRVTLDLEILDAKTRRVTTLQVDASEWPDSGNPWGPASTMVEELFHGLGLDDSYDYIEGHADNDAMSQQHRLELFDIQLRRFAGQEPRYQPDLPSITKPDTSKPTDWDYCQVLAQQPHELALCRQEWGIGAKPP